MESWSLLFAIACGVSLIAAIIDYRTGHIPNAISLSLLALGIPLHALIPSLHAGRPLHWLWLDGLLGCLVSALVPFLLWRKGGIGGGDVKLLAGLGALLGFQQGLQLQLVAFSLAALIVPALLAFRGRLWSTLRNAGLLFLNPFLPRARRREIPPELMNEVRFGPAIFAASLLLALAQRWS